MRKLIPALLLCLLATACTTQRSLSGLSTELVAPTTTGERCLAIIRQMRHADIHQTGGPLLALLASERIRSPFYLPSGCVDPDPPIEVRIQTAAREVFRVYLAGPASQEDKVLLLGALLRAQEDSEGRRIVLGMLEYDFWHISLEEAVAAIAGDAHEPISLRLHAIRILMRRGDPNRYCAQGLSLIGEWPLHQSDRLFDDTDIDREMVFREVVGAADWSAFTATNRDRVIRLGFGIVREGQSISPGYGYFVASQLGTILNIKGGFAPDQNLPQYKGESGLNESFFADTIRNALAWADAHGL